MRKRMGFRCFFLISAPFCCFHFLKMHYETHFFVFIWTKRVYDYTVGDFFWNRSFSFTVMYFVNGWIYLWDEI